MGVIAEKLTSEKELVIKMFEDGMSAMKISKIYGCSEMIIFRFLKKHGVKTKRDSMYGHRFEEFQTMFESGKSVYAMANELNINHSTLTKILNDGGVDTSRGCKIRVDPIKNHTDEIIRLYLEEGLSESEIGKVFDCDASSVSRLLGKNNVKTRFMYDVDENFFETIDTEEKAYTLGFFTADGNLTKEGNFCIKVTDLDVLEKIKKAMRHTAPIKTIINTDPNFNRLPVYRLDVGREKIAKDLIEKDCPPNKTFKTKFPNPAIVPEHLLVHYIRGVFDGDGSINKCGRTWNISIAGTQELVEPMLDFIRKETGVKGGVYNHSNIKLLKVSGNQQVLKLADWLYKNATMYMDRKYSKYQEFKSEMNFAKMKKSDGIKPTRNKKERTNKDELVYRNSFDLKKLHR